MKKYLYSIIIATFFALIMCSNAFAANELESNDTMEQATEVFLNTGTTGAISSYEDEDWYKFTLVSNGKINLSFEHDVISSTSSYWSITLYSYDGVSDIKTWSIEGNEDSFLSCDIGLAAGTYYVEIGPRSSNYWNSKTYTFQINYEANNYYEKEFNENPSSANVIKTNTEYYGSIMTFSDEDWYKFTLASDGKINISFKHDVISSTSSYWNITLYSYDGVSDIKTWSIEGNEDSFLSCDIGLAAGTYYVEIEPRSSNYWNSNTYTFQINYEANNYYEKEFNEKPSSANVIKTNTEYYGSIMTSSDEDWYKFTLVSNGKITIDFSHVTYASTSCYWQVYIYKYDGVSGIISDSGNYWNVAGNKSLSTCEWGLPAGTYYVAIAPNSSNYWKSSTYTLKINFNKTNYYEKENNDLDNPTKINLNTNYYGVINRDYDSDWYQFEVKDKEEIVVSFNHEIYDNSSKYWSIHAYKSDGVTSVNGYYWNVSGNENFEINLGELEAGIYYVEIEPNSTNYWKNSTYTLNVGTIKNGLCKGADGNWYYYINNVVDTTYNGLASNKYGWWYVKNGKLNFSYTGMIVSDGQWVYVEKGKFNNTYTGMAQNKNGWWYMENGVLNRDYTGLYKGANGWIYINKGKFDTTYTGMACNKDGWWYIKDGRHDKTYTGLAQNKNGWWYMKDGKLDRTYTGMYKSASGWIYINKGKYDTTYTGLYKGANGLIYINKGRFDTSYTGMACNKDGWWYIKDGRHDKTYTGLAKNKNGWWYMKAGKLDRTYTGMYKSVSGWIYINEGKYDTSFTGMARNKYGWWYIKEGRLDTTYTGLVKNEYGYWYFENGSLDTTFCGTIKLYGKTYTIKNGKVV